MTPTSHEVTQLLLAWSAGDEELRREVAVLLAYDDPGASFINAPAIQVAARTLAAEFQKILDHRGEAPLSVLYTFAHLGLARAAALASDLARSRRAYQGFFGLWKDADPDLPILRAARHEYDRLKT